MARWASSPPVVLFAERYQGEMVGGTTHVGGDGVPRVGGGALGDVSDSYTLAGKLKLAGRRAGGFSWEGGRRAIGGTEEW